MKYHLKPQIGMWEVTNCLGKGSEDVLEWEQLNASLGRNDLGGLSQATALTDGQMIWGKRGYQRTCLSQATYLPMWETSAGANSITCHPLVLTKAGVGWGSIPG